VRGEGGYVVAPPSIHANGKPYEWDDSPFENEITMIDDTVIKFLSIKDDSEGETSEDGTKQLFVVPEVIPEGKRNDTLFKLAASLWSSRRLSKEAVIAAVKVENTIVDCFFDYAAKEMPERAICVVKLTKSINNQQIVNYTTIKLQIRNIFAV
jgi:hypothetical protein